jgi:hypothetical protein
LKYGEAKKEVLFWRWDRKYENLNFDKIGNGSKSVEKRVIQYLSISAR